MPRMRLRELGIQIGRLPTGPYNAITDVPGVWVGHVTLIEDQPRTLRTGVTVVVPREGAIWRDHAFAGSFIFNGNGEMTGLAWVEESGLLTTPIGLTNTHSVGVVRDALIAYAAQDQTLLPGEVLGSGTATGGSGLELDRWIQPGDVIEMEAGPIGVLRNTVGIPNRKDN